MLRGYGFFQLPKKKASTCSTRDHASVMTVPARRLPSGRILCSTQGCCFVDNSQRWNANPVKVFWLESRTVLVRVQAAQPVGVRVSNPRQICQ